MCWRWGWVGGWRREGCVFWTPTRTMRARASWRANSTGNWSWSWSERGSERCHWGENARDWKARNGHGGTLHQLQRQVPRLGEEEVDVVLSQQHHSDSEGGWEGEPAAPAAVDQAAHPPPMVCVRREELSSGLDGTS